MVHASKQVLISLFGPIEVGESGDRRRSREKTSDSCVGATNSRTWPNHGGG